MVFPKLKHKKQRAFIFGLCVICLSSFSLSGQQLLMQGWYWDYPKDGCNGYNGDTWAEVLDAKASELSAAGFTHIWFPPHATASFGSCSNGYDPQDLFIGSSTTGLGTRAQVDAMLSTFTNEGIDPVADLIYNHRDGGQWESNPAVKTYIADGCCGTTNEGNPYPNDRYRMILPLGGSSGNEDGDYYFKFSSKSGDYYDQGYEYKLYMWTNTVNTYNPNSINESEPNGGIDCGQSYNTITLATDFFGEILNNTGGAGGCGTDEILLQLSPSDYDSNGDTLYIELRNHNSGYHDFRPYGVWSTHRSQDIVDDLIYQTATDFSGLPSGRGDMDYNSFRPNDNNVNSEKLDGDWNSMLFFYDYDQFQSSTIDTLNAWTEWNWDELGVRGIRMDAIKHFTPDYVSNMLNYMHNQGKNPSLVVGEWFDTNTGAQENWINEVVNGMSTSAQSAIDPKVFDFSLREALRASCDDFGYDVRTIFNNSLVDATSLSGFNVSTFVNNHDFRETSGGNTLIENEPILAYAYILTNNQLGVPTVFYPDYYGYPESGDPGYQNYFPTGLDPMKPDIDLLWEAHQLYIEGADGVDYLNNFSSGYAANFIEGASETTLLYQLSNPNTNKAVIVAINFAGDTLKVDHGINTYGGAIPQGEKFTDVLGRSAFPEAVVDNSNQIYVELPPRSYSVWVQGDDVQLLPIRFLEARAIPEVKSNKIEWTAEQDQMDHFRIDRWEDGQWIGVREVEPKSHTGTFAYTFNDFGLDGRNYYLYRIAGVDPNGETTFSNILRVDRSTYEKASWLSIYPNPVQSDLTIGYTGGENANYRIYNMMGQKVKEGRLHGGQNQIRVANLVSGNYYLKVEEEILRFAKL
jgi:alpha-amylase